MRCNSSLSRTLYRPTKTNQHCRVEDCLSSIWNDLPHGLPYQFNDKATLCDFERDFDFVLLQLVDTLNTQFKYREGS